MVEDKYRYKVDSFMLIASLRYALGRHTFALSIVKDNLQNNLKEIPNHELEQMMKEVSDYYDGHKEDIEYHTALEIITMIKRELYGEGS